MDESLERKEYLDELEANPKSFYFFWLRPLMNWDPLVNSCWDVLVYIDLALANLTKTPTRECGKQCKVIYLGVPTTKAGPVSFKILSA